MQSDLIFLSLRRVHETLVQGAPDAAVRATLVDPLAELQRHNKGAVVYPPSVDEPAACCSLTPASFYLFFWQRPKWS